MRVLSLTAALAAAAVSSSAGATDVRGLRWFAPQRFYITGSIGSTDYRELGATLAPGLVARTFAQLPAAPGGVTAITHADVRQQDLLSGVLFATVGYQLSPHWTLEAGYFWLSGPSQRARYSVDGHTSAVGGQTAGHDVPFNGWGEIDSQGLQFSLGSAYRLGSWPLVAFARAGALNITTRATLMGCGHCPAIVMDAISGRIISETRYADDFGFDAQYSARAWVPVGTGGVSLSSEDVPLALNLSYQYARVSDSLGGRTPLSAILLGFSYTFGYPGD